MGLQTSKYLPSSTQPSSIPLILLAIVDDLLRLAGLAAVFFIIWAGAQYIISQGSPDQAARAKDTIVNAFIGLVIALVAIAFVGYLGAKLGG